MHEPYAGELDAFFISWNPRKKETIACMSKLSFCCVTVTPLQSYSATRTSLSSAYKLEFKFHLLQVRDKSGEVER